MLKYVRKSSSSWNIFQHIHLSVSLQEASSDLDGAPMDNTPLDGLPLDRAPVGDLDGCPMGWDPLDGVPVDDIDGVPLGVAIDDIDGMPRESDTYQKHIVHPLLSVICPGQLIHPVM